MKALIATSQNKINAFQRVHKKRKESHALNHRQCWLCIISLKGRYIHASQFVSKTAHENQSCVFSLGDYIAKY